MRIDTQLPLIVRMGSELIEKLTHIEDGQIRSAMREIHDVLIHCLIEGQINKATNAGGRMPVIKYWAAPKACSICGGLWSAKSCVSNDHASAALR